jgi:uncharacterized membrane protein (DUF2068 family)
VARQPVSRKPAENRRPRNASRSSSTILVLIGLFKLLKALLLVVLGIGALRYLHKDLAAGVMHWADVLRVDPDNRFVHSLLLKVFRVTPKQLKELSAGTFIYAALFATEGIGLVLRKRWAEYFTIITTSLLIPVEVYEMIRHLTAIKVGVLALNVAIVLYLIARLRSK